MPTAVPAEIPTPENGGIDPPTSEARINPVPKATMATPAVPRRDPTAESTPAPPTLAPTPTPFSPSAEGDRQILEELYHSTNGDAWTNNDKWLSDQPLQEWYGVETEHERVVELDLAANGLSGSLPARLWLLDNLETLYLENNALTGEIPPLEIDGTSQQQLYFRVTTIDISDNQLSGCVPISLTEAVGTNDGEYSPLERCPHPDREALEALYNGTGGPDWIKQENWMTDAPLSDWQGVTATRDGKVIRLELVHNNLVGPITAITNLHNLEVLSIGNNIGSDVAKARREGKDTLSLIAERRGNRITLPLPEELFTMSRLEALQLRTIGLTGQLPAGFANMENLKVLDLAYNDLESPLPSEVQDFRSLVRLNLTGNLYTGPIPLELTRIKTLESLNLSRNQFQGGIPVELTNLTGLKYVKLSRNPLGGELPPELGSMPQLVTLILEYCMISGPIPEELGSLPALTNEASEIEGYMWLEGNQFTGEIPASLGKLIRLRELALGRNQLSGKIPQELANLDNLTFLGLGHNMLTGRLPRQLAEMKSLQGLSVGDNQLTGKIPKEFNERQDLKLYSGNNNLDN